MKWDAAHGNGRAGRLAAGSQSDIENVGGCFGIIVKQFIEIAHAVKQQLIRMLCLDAKILLHHGGMLG